MTAQAPAALPDSVTELATRLRTLVTRHGP